MPLSTSLRKPRAKYYWTILDYGGERVVEAKLINQALIFLDFCGYLLFLALVDGATRMKPCADRMIAHWDAHKAADNGS